MVSPVYSSKGTFNTSATPDPCTFDGAVTLTCPVTVDAGDVLITAVQATYASGTVNTITTPAGWTLLNDDLGEGTTRVRKIYYKIADGTEDSATFDVTANFSAAAAGARISGQVYRFTGAASGSPVKTTSGGASSGSNDTLTATGVTAGSADAIAVMIAFTSSRATGSFTGETNGDWVQQATDNNGTTGYIVCQTDELAASGQVSGGSYTMAGTTAWRTFTFYIEAPGGGSLLIPRSTMQSHHIFR